MGEISRNIEEVRNRIADASGGRDVTLVGVSKYQPIESIIEAQESGLHIFGENRIQEMMQKIEVLGSDKFQWHFIGNLQKNKIKYITSDVKMIQSLDSENQVLEIQNRLSTKMDVLLQVNIGREPQKSGILPENVHKYVAIFEKFDRINVCGLMCIPPKVGNPNKCFIHMRDIFSSLQDAGKENIRILSMGMSADYETAIQCGSNMVRVGTAIFGSRKI